MDVWWNTFFFPMVKDFGVIQHLYFQPLENAEKLTPSYTSQSLRAKTPEKWWLGDYIRFFWGPVTFQGLSLLNFRWVVVIEVRASFGIFTVRKKIARNDFSMIHIWWAPNIIFCVVWLGFIYKLTIHQLCIQKLKIKTVSYKVGPRADRYKWSHNL